MELQSRAKQSILQDLQCEVIVTLFDILDHICFGIMKLPGSLPTSRDCADIRPPDLPFLSRRLAPLGACVRVALVGLPSPSQRSPQDQFFIGLRFFLLRFAIFVIWTLLPLLRFTAIFVSGPIERGVFLESGHNDREANMPRPSVTGQCDRNCDRTSPKRSEVLTATLYGGKTRREWCEFNENKTPWRTNIRVHSGIAGANAGPMLVPCFPFQVELHESGLQLLADCVKDAQAQQAQAWPRVGRISASNWSRRRIFGAMLMLQEMPKAPLLTAKEDRFAVVPGLVCLRRCTHKVCTIMYYQNTQNHKVKLCAV